MRTIILIVLMSAWVSFFLGMVFILLKTDLSIRFEKYLWNSRIEKLNKKPFSIFIKAYEQQNYIKSLIMVFLINFPMVIFMFLMGLSIVGVLFVIIQSFMMGSIIIQGDKKNRIFGIATVIFELNAFATSCIAGFLVSVYAVFSNISFIQSIANIANYLWIPILLLFLNSVVEAGGSLVGANGIPGVDNVKNKNYK